MPHGLYNLHTSPFPFPATHNPTHTHIEHQPHNSRGIFRMMMCCLRVGLCCWLVVQCPWLSVYGDNESRWTAMLTGEGSLTLGVSVLTPLLGFTCLKSSQQQDLVCACVCVCFCFCVPISTAGRESSSHKQRKAI